MDNKNKTKSRLVLLILLIIIGIVMISSGTLLMFSNDKKSTIEDKKESENKKEEWKSYVDIKKYEYASLKATNLETIDVDLGKISFKTLNGVRGTLDFSNSSYVPNCFSSEGFEGNIYMTIEESFDLESWKKNYSSSDSSVFNNILTKKQKVKFYTADKKNAYANLVLQIGESYWIIGVNIESKTIEEAEEIFKELIPLVVEYDEDAITIEDFSREIFKKIEFNIPNFDLNNVEISGNALTFVKKDGRVFVNGFSSSFYNSYFLAFDEYVSISFLQSYNIDNEYEVMETKVKGLDTRIYHKVMDEYEYYKVGFIYKNKEYVFDLLPVNSSEGFDEEKIIEFLNKIIKD